MKSKTHIIILHMKEIIYTIIFAILTVLVAPAHLHVQPPKNRRYYGGNPQTHRVFIQPPLTSAIPLVGVEVTVTQNGLADAGLCNIDEATALSYPLLETL